MNHGRKRKRGNHHDRDSKRFRQQDEDQIMAPRDWVPSFAALAPVFSNVRFIAVPCDPVANLSNQLWSHFQTTRQTANEFNRKIDLWTELNSVIGRECGSIISVFGSTINGFANENSDLDLCVFNLPMDDQVQFLARIRRVLRNTCPFLSKDIELVPAKVPILKLYDNYGKFHVDLSCSNQQAIRNSHLLFAYSQVDWRVRPLVLGIKNWARNEAINDARFSTISSYTLTLMVLHFLQCGVQPPVIPSLHISHPQIFHSSSDIFQLQYQQCLPPFVSTNLQSLGSLFQAFFGYYADFNFMAHCGSVRTGTVLSIEQCHRRAQQTNNSPGQWNAYICMEEPFNFSNAGRAIIKRPQFDKILNAFDGAVKKLSKRQCYECLLRICSKHNCR